jgi:cell division protein FtsB
MSKNLELLADGLVHAVKEHVVAKLKPLQDEISRLRAQNEILREDMRLLRDEVMVLKRYRNESSFNESEFRQ